MTTPWLNAFYLTAPDASIPSQRITFGTAGHRGSSLTASFNELHILAIAQAVVDYRQQAGISEPLFLGLDTHALSRPVVLKRCIRFMLRVISMKRICSS